MYVTYSFLSWWMPAMLSNFPDQKTYRHFDPPLSPIPHTPYCWQFFWLCFQNIPRLWSLFLIFSFSSSLKPLSFLAWVIAIALNKAAELDNFSPFSNPRNNVKVCEKGSKTLRYPVLFNSSWFHFPLPLLASWHQSHWHIAQTWNFFPNFLSPKLIPQTQSIILLSSSLFYFPFVSYFLKLK